jgi:tRNA threonylcarbamoyl adenosine modification protein YeaZ
MLVLALDTTSEKGGAAIYRDSVCLATVENEGPANIYSITLFQMVARALEQAGIKPSRTGREDGAAPHPSADGYPGATLGALGDMDLFAVANGPGSFTGIRVGAAAVQAWARAFGRPVRGVSILEAMVDEARPETEWAVPILDARRGEFFLECFRRTAQPLVEPHGAEPCIRRLTDTRAKREVPQRADYQAEDEGWVLRPSDLSTFLRERLPAGQPAGVTCLVRESDHVALALRDVLPKSYRWQSVAGTLLKAIARLGLEAHRKGITQEPADLHACYIRRPDAELNWRE